MGIGTFASDEVEITTGGLDHFTAPPVDILLEDGKTIIIKPLHALSDEGPFEFVISSDNDNFLYLPMTRLHGTLQILKSDGNKVDATSNLSVVNLFPQTIFKQVEIEINGMQINDLSTPTYAIKAYLETLLSYGLEAKNAFLRGALWEPDSLGKEENFTKGTDSMYLNRGFQRRQDKIKESKKFTFVSIIHADLNQSERFMLPNVAIKYTFIRNPDKYSLFGDTGDFKIKVLDLYMTVRKIKVKPDFHRSILQTLSKEPAIYPLTQSKIKTFLINKGTSSVNIQNLSSGNLPKTIIIGFLEDTAFNGALNKNPHLYKHFDLNYMNLQINSEPFHKTPLQPNYTDGKYMREYQLLLDNIGVHHSNAAFSISPDDFVNACNLYAFDLTPDCCNSVHFHYIKKGQVDIELAWANALTSNIKMIVYSTYRQTLTIDSNYNCLLLE
jgi:hypothetical protein